MENTSKQTGKGKSRKRNQAQSQNPVANSPEVQQAVLSPSADETPGPSKAMKKDLSQKQTKKKETSKEPTFFDHKKDIAKSKHGILFNYLSAWLAILSNNKARFFNSCSYSRLVYIDGFAGPGRYKENDDTGSPIIAYSLALNHKGLPENGPEIDMIFIEKTPDESQTLLANLRQVKAENLNAKNVSKVKFMVINDAFATAMTWILSNDFTFTDDQFVPNVPLEYSQNSSIFDDPFITQNTPLFVFVDPFGYNGERIPMTLMQKILETTTKAEILINLMTGSLQRFLNLDNQARAINLLVGQNECDGTWKPIVLEDANAKGIEKMKKFLDHYSDKITEQLQKTTYVAVFEMRNSRNGLLYNLFYVCLHQLAFCKMKDAMRRCSQSDLNFKYSSFKAKDVKFTRETLEIEKLVQDIIHHFSDVEFQGRPILGSEITQLINEDETLYQRYKRELKPHFEKFRIDKKKGGRQKFDEMSFRFFLPENDNDNED